MYLCQSRSLNSLFLLAPQTSLYIITSMINSPQWATGMSAHFAVMHIFSSHLHPWSWRYVYIKIPVFLTALAGSCPQAPIGGKCSDLNPEKAITVVNIFKTRSAFYRPPQKDLPLRSFILHRGSNFHTIIQIASCSR